MSEKILNFVSSNTKEIDLKIYWDSSDDCAGWIARLFVVSDSGDRQEDCLLLDQYGSMVRLETVVEFFAQDYLPKSWYQDFSMWNFGFDSIKYATTTIPSDHWSLK
jgi:hypothetical protein